MGDSSSCAIVTALDLSPALAGLNNCDALVLGLTPQALCFRLLRRLSDFRAVDAAPIQCASQSTSGSLQSLSCCFILSTGAQKRRREHVCEKRHHLLDCGCHTSRTLGHKAAARSHKSFFIPSIQYGRDMVELMQRIDLDPTTDSIDRSWDINCWGIGDLLRS